MNTCYSFPNIDRSHNCFSYSPGANTPFVDVIIPEGSHHVEDINKFIQREMRTNTTRIKHMRRITLKYLLIPIH